jgi:ABC-type polar amino acid transport system ATPase subunit
MKELDEEGITQVVVTHEMRFARDVADEIVFMADGQVVERGGPGNIFTDPQEPRTRQFLRRYI